MGSFDISLKHVVNAYPHDWAVFLGAPPDAPVQMIDTDLSTVQALADKILAVGGPQPFLLHLEMQAQYDPDLDARVHTYVALLHRRHQLPVQSTVILLDRRAGGPAVTGQVAMASPTGRCTLDFQYELIKVWQQPPEFFLQQGLGILPLAPLSAATVEELPPVIERMAERFTAETDSGEAAELWTATLVLLGIKYKRQTVRWILQQVRQQMHISDTYQEILEEGEEKGKIQTLRQMILRLGTELLGSPPTTVSETIGREQSVTALEDLLIRIVHVNSWDELF